MTSSPAEPPLNAGVVRSMKGNKGRGTKPELAVRKALREAGFLMNRCMRVIPFDEDEVQASLKHFDDTVRMIETNVQSETRNSKDVMSHWKGNPKAENCTACDAKTFCPYVKGSFPPTVP